ncbi:unnamed protein product [Closterium sp. NIES-53]
MLPRCPAAQSARCPALQPARFPCTRCPRAATCCARALLAQPVCCPHAVCTTFARLACAAAAAKLLQPLASSVPCPAVLPPAAALGAVPLVLPPTAAAPGDVPLVLPPTAAALGAAATCVRCPVLPCPALAPPCPECYYIATAACVAAACTTAGPAKPPCRAAFAAAAAAAATALATATAAVIAAMATPTVLALDAEGHPIQFESWLEDLTIVADEGGRSGAGRSGGGGHQELEPSCVATCAPTCTVYAHPSFVLSCLVVPSASSGSTEGGDPTVADTTTSRRSPRFETPPGFLPRTSSPPQQPVIADFGGPGVVEGGDAKGSSSGGAASGGARSPLVDGVGGTGAGGASAGGAGSGGALQSLPRRPIFLEQPSSSLPEPTPTCTTPPLLFPPPDSPLLALARYISLSVYLTGRRVPVSCAASPATPRVPREPVVLPLPTLSSLHVVPDPMSDLARAARPTIPCCLAALVTTPASSRATASALVAELAGFAATCRCAYLAGLVSASSCPPSVGGELVFGCDVLEDRQIELEYLPYPLSIRTPRPGDTTLRIGGLLGGCCATCSVPNFALVRSHTGQHYLSLDLVLFPICSLVGTFSWAHHDFFSYLKRASRRFHLRRRALCPCAARRGPALAARRGPALEARPCPHPLDESYAPAPPVAKPRRPDEPRRLTAPPCPTEPHCCASAPTTATAAFAATAATLATAPTAAMASPTVLTFDAEGRAVDFDVWVENLHLFLQCDSRDGVSLFDHTSGVSTAPTAIADSMLRYSSPATAALSRLMLPYLFPDLAAFATVADLVAHLRTSDAHYRAALPTEDHFLSLCPTELTVDLLEERLTAAEKSILAVGASRGDRRTPFFEECSPVPLLPSFASAAAVDLIGTEEVGARLPLLGDAAPAGARGARVVAVAAGGAVEEVEEAKVVAVVEVVAAVAEVVEAAAAVVAAAAAVLEVEVAVVLVEVQPRSVEALVAASASSNCALVRPCRSSSFVSGTLGVGGLGLRNVPIFDLDFDSILAAMYAIADSAEGDCYLSVPPGPGIAAAALGASASTAPGTGVSAALGASASAAPGAGASALSGNAPTKSLHTFTLDSGASRSFFRDSTSLTPLSRPVAVSLADPSGGPVLAHSSTVLPCPATPSGLLSGLHLPSFSTKLVSGADLQDAWVDQFTLGGQRVTHCTCSRTGCHLATFTRRPGSSLYTLTIAPPPVSVSGQVAASSQVFAAASRSAPASAPCSCRPLSHETLLWNHRLGHPSLPRLRGMASRALVSGLPRSLPPLPPRPAPTCVPCVEGRQRAAPHSSSFPQTEAPFQTLHMDVWGPARVRGQGHERYFLLVVDEYSRYTTVFPLRGKGEVPEVLIDWIRGARRKLSESFGSDLPTFTLPASPQKNGIAERRIGMVMDVARTSMIHAAAPHFLWPFAVQYAAHQINLQPCVSLPETTPTLRWTGKVGDASVFCVWGSRASVRDSTAEKLSSRAIPCVFLGFPPDAPGWQFYHPTSHYVLSSQDVTFDESVSYYRLFPYRTASLPPRPLFLAPGTPPVDPLPPQGPAPSGVSQVDPAELVEVAVDSGAARGADPAGAGTRGCCVWRY